jgi:nucleotide-binding universal stress UspA family protein
VRGTEACGTRRARAAVLARAYDHDHQHQWIEDAQLPPTELAAHLARHGLKAEVERINAGRADVQPLILSIAADASMDLLVMGAYGHSRLQERLLGGVSRGMFQSMTVPTLMSH